MREFINLLWAFSLLGTAPILYFYNDLDLSDNPPLYCAFYTVVFIAVQTTLYLLIRQGFRTVAFMVLGRLLMPLDAVFLALSLMGLLFEWVRVQIDTAIKYCERQ